MTDLMLGVFFQETVCVQYVHVCECVCVKQGSVRLFTQLGSTLSHNPTSLCPPKHVPLQKPQYFLSSQS